MKILVLSDTHGNIKNLDFILQNVKCDFIFHLGDGLKDLTNYANLQNLHRIKGNCDFFINALDEESLEINGIKIFITHGNNYGVKYTLETISKRAEELNADLVCFGHTHKYFNTCKNDITYLNPGSLGAGSKNSCAIVNIDNNKKNNCNKNPNKFN